MILFTAVRVKLLDYCLGLFFKELGNNLLNDKIPLIQIGRLAKRIESNGRFFSNCELVTQFNYELFGTNYHSLLIRSISSGKTTSILIDNNTKIYY
jgi:hypothetical protein